MFLTDQITIWNLKRSQWHCFENTLDGDGKYVGSKALVSSKLQHWPILSTRESCKLRCYTRFPNPEKSRNTREKKIFFSRVFNIANQLLKRHSPFAPLGHVDE